MIIFNGIKYTELAELEKAMEGLSEDQKLIIRNDFNKIENVKVESFIPVTNQQLRQALILKSFGEDRPGIHPDAISAFLRTLPEPTRSLAINYWDQSGEMLRDNEMLIQLSPMVGLTSEDLDKLWLHAKTLN